MSAARHKLLQSSRVFNGKIFDVYIDRVRLPHGDVVEREVVRHPGAVGIVVLQRGRILMVRQMRHATGVEMMEIPAGKLDIEGESPIQCAMRELQEETGYTCDRLEPMAVFYNSPGFSDEKFHLYLAVGASKLTEPPAHDEGEPILVEWVGLDEVLEGSRAGEILDAKTLIALTLCKLRLEEARGDSTS